MFCKVQEGKFMFSSSIYPERTRGNFQCCAHILRGDNRVETKSLPPQFLTKNLLFFGRKRVTTTSKYVTKSQHKFAVNLVTH